MPDERFRVFDQHSKSYVLVNALREHADEYAAELNRLHADDEASSAAHSGERYVVRPAAVDG